jgi:cell wall-associated NlpC family hydrolase
MMPTARATVVAQARAWLGTPYAHQHRARGIAADCAGLLIGVARELGIVAPEFDVTGYARSPDGRSLLAHCDAFMRRIPGAAMRPGDAIACRFGNDPQHIAILGDYVHGGLSIIHALNRSNGRGAVIEQRLDPRLRLQLVQAYALPGVE